MIHDSQYENHMKQNSLCMVNENISIYIIKQIANKKPHLINHTYLITVNM